MTMTPEEKIVKAFASLVQIGRNFVEPLLAPRFLQRLHNTLSALDLGSLVSERRRELCSFLSLLFFSSSDFSKSGIFP